MSRDTARFHELRTVPYLQGIRRAKVSSLTGQDPHLLQAEDFSRWSLLELPCMTQVDCVPSSQHAAANGRSTLKRESDRYR